MHPIKKRIRYFLVILFFAAVASAQTCPVAKTAGQDIAAVANNVTQNLGSIPDVPHSSAPTAVDLKYCHGPDESKNLVFHGHSINKMSGVSVTESIDWDNNDHAFHVCGPLLSSMFGYPNVANIEGLTDNMNICTEIKIRSDSAVVSRGQGVTGFSESADCAPSHSVTYTQTYTIEGSTPTTITIKIVPQDLYGNGTVRGFELIRYRANTDPRDDVEDSEKYYWSWDDLQGQL